MFFIVFLRFLKVLDGFKWSWKGLGCFGRVWEGWEGVGKGVEWCAGVDKARRMRDPTSFFFFHHSLRLLAAVAATTTIRLCA